MLNRDTRRKAMALRRRVVLATLLGVFVLASVQQANACACCSAQGDRMDLVSKLDSFYSDELSHLRFGNTAELFLGEADPDMVKGIATPAARYDLQAS